MKLIRKITAVMLAVMMLVPMGCTEQTAGDDETLDIVCTIFPQYDLARSIAGETTGVNIKMLMGAGQESHDYDPSSKDIAAIHGCDIFVYTGGESDSWIRDLLESVDTENKTVISLMDIVDPMESETVEGMETEEHDHDHGAIDHVEYDEHVWTSLKNAKTISDAICEAMCNHMPESADAFRANFESLAGQLDSLDQSFKELADSVESPTIVVADRFPLLYFCKEYGRKYYAAVAGCAASTEPSSKTVQFLIEKVKEDNIPAVFKMDLSSGNVADTVAEATGARVLTFYSCHTLSSSDFDAGETYVSMMERNLEALKTAFGAESES
ncbi:MAG: zinc ABC transporter substrate-binding protein [Clostridia bacterium]|nr:zinc ABC transporter substrate-binding protein [Clostridia bacterium]